MGEYRDVTQDRVTIQEAARRLGVKEDAIRKRIQCGSIRHEKDEDGRVYVWVERPRTLDVHPKTPPRIRPSTQPRTSALRI